MRKSQRGWFCPIREAPRISSTAFDRLPGICEADLLDRQDDPALPYHQEFGDEPVQQKVESNSLHSEMNNNRTDQTACQRYQPFKIRFPEAIPHLYVKQLRLEKRHVLLSGGRHIYQECQIRDLPGCPGAMSEE